MSAELDIPVFSERRPRIRQAKRTSQRRYEAMAREDHDWPEEKAIQPRIEISTSPDEVTEPPLLADQARKLSVLAEAENMNAEERQRLGRRMTEMSEFPTLALPHARIPVSASLSLADELRFVLAETNDDGVTLARALMEVLVARGLMGDVNAIKEVLQRTDGKVPDRLITGSDPLDRLSDKQLQDIILLDAASTPVDEDVKKEEVTER